MAPAHELLRGLPEVAKYLRYDPRRLALAERARANQVGYEFLMRLYCARHDSRMADSGTGMQDSCPISGKNMTLWSSQVARTRLGPSTPTVTAAAASHGHSAPLTRGSLCRCDQPDSVSASGLLMRLWKYQPTAVQGLAEVQATPSKALLVEAPGLGVFWILHDVPFHRSAS